MEIQQEALKFPTAESDLLDILQKSILNELIRKVGHEINNQLTGIFGYLSLAQIKSKSPAKLHEYIERIQQCCETSQTLTNNIFLFSEKISQTELCNLVDEANKIYSLLFKTENVFEYEIELATEKLVLPYAGFKTLLFFYMLLIRDATPDSGIIITKVHDAEQPGDDAKALWVSIDIHSEVNQELAGRKIAEFSNPQGFDQSISIRAAHDLVKLWGGKTVLNHTNPDMPIVRLTLPVAQTKPRAFIHEYRRRENPPNSKESPKVLLLEDQDAICKFIHELLQDEGFESVVFNSGYQLDSALTRLDLDTFHLFLLDIFVPGPSGLELAMRIRGKKPDAKLLFYSALTNLDTVEKLFPLGPTTMFMPKPFKKEELIANIHEMLEVESV